MHRLTVLLLFSVLLLPAATDLSGRYAGEWKSNGGGGSGSFQMGLEAQSGGAWKCEFGFTFGGDDIKTTIRACKVEKTKLEANYDFELQGNARRWRKGLVGQQVEQRTQPDQIRRAGNCTQPLAGVPAPSP